MLGVGELPESGLVSDESASLLQCDRTKCLFSLCTNPSFEELGEGFSSCGYSRLDEIFCSLFGCGEKKANGRAEKRTGAAEKKDTISAAVCEWCEWCEWRRGVVVVLYTDIVNLDFK